MEYLTKHTHESITTTSSTKCNANNIRFTIIDAQIEDNARQDEANTNILEIMQTRIDAFESNSSSSSSGCHKRNDQNSIRADAIGFTESPLKKKSERYFLSKVIKEHAMQEGLEDVHCPAKPITHVFLKFKTEKRPKRIPPNDQQTTIYNR